MDDVPGHMQIVQRRQQSAQGPTGLDFIVLSSIRDPIKEVATRQVLHDKVECLGGRIHVKQFDNVWVVECPKDLSFGQQSRRSGGGFCRMRMVWVFGEGHYLDRSGDARPSFNGPPDFSHCPFSQNFTQVIVEFDATDRLLLWVTARGDSGWHLSRGYHRLWKGCDGGSMFRSGRIGGNGGPLGWGRRLWLFGWVSHRPRIDGGLGVVVGAWDWEFRMMIVAGMVVWVWWIHWKDVRCVMVMCGESHKHKRVLLQDGSKGGSRSDLFGQGLWIEETNFITRMQQTTLMSLKQMCPIDQCPIVRRVFDIHIHQTRVRLLNAINASMTIRYHPMRPFEQFAAVDGGFFRVVRGGSGRGGGRWW